MEKLTLSDRRCQQPTKCTSQGRRAEEEGEALLGLAALIPHSEQIETSWEHAALKEAQKESSCEDARVVLRQALEDHDEAEANAADRQPYPWGELLEEDIGGDLEEDVYLFIMVSDCPFRMNQSIHSGCALFDIALDSTTLLSRPLKYHRSSQKLTRHKEDGQNRVVLDSPQIQVFQQPKRLCIGNIHTVQEGQ